MKLGTVGTMLALALGLAGCGSVVVLAGPDGGNPGTDAGLIDRSPVGDTPQPLVDHPGSIDDAGRPCTTDAECGAGFACYIAVEGGCDVPRTCQVAQRQCPTNLTPYCGCDGVTFYTGSRCQNLPWIHRGECETPRVDGGLRGCDLGDGRVCPVGTSCNIGGCVTCFCAGPGMFRCLGGDPGACSDGGVIPPGQVCEDSRDCPTGSRCAGEEGCGVPWTCQSAGDGCTADIAAFCGCDGTSFEGSSSCPGRPYAHRGNCGIVPRDAGGPPPLCPPQDARGVGNCDGFFGYAWNGAMCVGVSGCSCSGSECGALASSPAACESAHMACPRPI